MELHGDLPSHPEQMSRKEMDAYLQRQAEAILGAATIVSRQMIQRLFDAGRSVYRNGRREGQTATASLQDAFRVMEKHALKEKRKNETPFTKPPKQKWHSVKKKRNIFVGNRAKNSKRVRFLS